jgi:hypothetical protein
LPLEGEHAVECSSGYSSLGVVDQSELARVLTELCGAAVDELHVTAAADLGHSRHDARTCQRGLELGSPAVLEQITQVLAVPVHGPVVELDRLQVLRVELTATRPALAEGVRATDLRSNAVAVLQNGALVSDCLIW